MNQSKKTRGAIGTSQKVENNSGLNKELKASRSTSKTPKEPSEKPTRKNSAKLSGRSQCTAEDQRKIFPSCNQEKSKGKIQEETSSIQKQSGSKRANGDKVSTLTQKEASKRPKTAGTESISMKIKEEKSERRIPTQKREKDDDLDLAKKKSMMMNQYKSLLGSYSKQPIGKKQNGSLAKKDK